jgi:hypothetical protein
MIKIGRETLAVVLYLGAFLLLVYGTVLAVAGFKPPRAPAPYEYGGVGIFGISVVMSAFLFALADTLRSVLGLRGYVVLYSFASAQVLLCYLASLWRY